MKKINFLLFFAIMILSIIQANAQTTTEEDYKFITQDLIKGTTKYRLKDLGSWGMENGNAQLNLDFKNVLRNNNSIGIAIYLIKTSNGEETRKIYCLPGKNSDKDIWEKAFNAIADENTDVQNAFLWGLMNMQAHN